MYNTNANNLSDATLNTGNIHKILTSWGGDAFWFIDVSIHWKKNNKTPKQKTHHTGNNTPVPKSSVIYCKLLLLEKLNYSRTYCVWND